MATPGNVVYEENDYPRMGAVRKSFGKNILLAKPRLGSARHVATNLPDDDWIYGICNEPDPEGVREVIAHKDNVPDHERKRGQDILAMNKLAAIKHAWRACEQRPFRNRHLIRLHISRRIGKSPSTKLPSELDPDYIYGRPGEKSEEMWKVMEQGYADEWIKMNLHHQHTFEMPKPNYVPPKMNKSAHLRVQEIYQKTHSPPPKQRFIISRFKNVPKKIDNVNLTPLKRD